MSQIKYLSKDILAALNRKYPRNRCKYKLSNAFIFKDDWETDFFVQKINYYCYEFEIKVSRADFNRDKLKIDKHKILKDGNYTRTIYKNRYQKETSIPYGEPIRTDIIPHTILPNKFYYVVPKEMIKVEEIPKYAGLIYFDGYNLETVKEADFIHKNKLEFEKILCNKFYNYWLNLKQKMDIVEINNRTNCPEFPYFGASYPDARCVDGVLHDLNKCDDNGNLYVNDNDDPCPFCRAQEYIDTHVDVENGITREQLEKHIKFLQERYN